jgi:hypothetical protein
METFTILTLISLSLSPSLTHTQKHTRHLSKSIAMLELQLIRYLIQQVRVYGGIAHLEAVQIPLVPVIMVGSHRLAEVRYAQYL